MSYNNEYYDDRQSEEDSNAGAPSQLLSPTQAPTTRYSASLSESSLIESLDNDQDDDSVASIDVNRVGFTPRTSVALTDTDAASDEHPYGYAEDPYARANDSMDERDVEDMLLSERSMQYDDEDRYDHDQQYSGQHEEGRQYDEYSESIDGNEEDFGFLPGHQPHDWPHEILTVEDVRTRRTKPLSTIAERSSVGSRSQASQFSPKALSEEVPPVPRIPSIFRQQTGEEMLRSISATQGQDPSPPASLRSQHSRASTDPGAAPPYQARSVSPVKSTSTSSSRGVRDRIAFFEERVASPAPGLVQGARPGSPSGTYGLGLGLGLSGGGLGLSLVRSPASMLSTPFSPAQSMPPMSPNPQSGLSYQSSMSSLSRSRPASPVKSVKSNQSSEAPSANIPSYASSPHVQHYAPVAPQQPVSSRATDAYRQSVSDDLLRSQESLHQPQESLGHQPQPGYVQRVLAAFRPVEETGPGLFDVRRRQSLRRASAGATEHGSGHGHERSSSEPQRAGGSGSGGARSAPSHKSTPSQGSRPRSEGGSGDGSVAADRSDMPLGTNAEEPLRVGNLWYLHVHTGDERFRWIKCKAVLFRSQLQLTWVEAGGGKAIIGLDLLNCHEVRSVPSPNHASAWEDIGNVAARAQALDEAGIVGATGGVEELCPFQMLYEDGVERLGAGSPRERMKWVGAIWDALNRASVVPSRTSSPAQSIGTIPSQRSNDSGTGSGSGSRHGSASTVFIPPDEDVPDMGSTISSLSRSSFRSVPMDSPYQSDSFYSARKPRSVDDASLPSHGHEFLSPADARIAIGPSRSSSLRRTSSMTDLDEYASAASPRTETFQSESEFDMPRLPSRGPSSIESRSLAAPRTIASGSSLSSASSASSPGRPLPELPTLSSIPSMPSLRSGTSERYDTATGYTSTVSGRYDTATDVTATGSARYTTGSTPTARRDTVSTTTATARRFDTPLGTARSTSTLIPPAVAALRPPSAPPAPKTPSESGSTASSFLTAPSTRMKTPAPKEAGSTIYSPSDEGPVRRIRPGKASSVYSLSSVNEQERHRQAAEDSSTVDEYGSMLSSPAPSISSVGTPKLLGTTTLPRLAFRGPDSGSMLGDSHVGGSPGTGTSSSSSRSSETGKSYATPRTPSRLSRIVEQPTGSSVTSLVRSLPGARPKSSRFPAPKSAATSATYLTAEDKENSQESSSESYHTATDKTPTKSTYSAGSVTSEPLSVSELLTMSRPLSVTQEAATADLARSDTQPARSDTQSPPSDVDSMDRNESEDEEEDVFDPQGTARLSRQDSYYTTTSAGLARAGSIAGDSTYSTIAYDICVGTDVSSSEPRSVRSVTPTPLPSTPYQSAPEPPASPMSMSSIPTIRTESQYNTPDQVDSSTEYSSAMRWSSPSEYATVPLGSSPTQSSILPPLPSSKSSTARASTLSMSPALPSTPTRPASARVSTPSVSSTVPPTPIRPASARISTASVSPALPPTPMRPASARVSTPSVSTPIMRSIRGTPTPSVVGSIPDAMSEISVTSATLSSESSVTPTQSRTMSLASRSPTGTPISTPKGVSAPRSISSQSSVSRQPKSTTVSSVSSLSTSTASSASSVTASPLPTPMSASSRSLSSVTTSLRTPVSFLMPPVPPPSSTRSTRSKPVSEVSYASSPQQSMASSLFEYTPSANSTILPGVDESFDTSFLRPTVASSDVGQYDIVLVESEGVSTPGSSSKVTSIPMAPTPSAMSSLLSPSSLTRSDSVSSVSSLRSSIFLPSRSSSMRSVAPSASISDMRTPRSPTVSVTMTPAQSFHPSFRDDLSTIPSEDEEALAEAPAPMEIISHDVNRLVQYLDGVDRQRVAEHDDVKDQLDRVEEGLKNLTDFIRQEALKPRAASPAETVQDLPEPTDDVVMHSAPRPAVILLDLPAPESPLKLSSGSVTDSIAWLSSPSSVSMGLQGPPTPFQPSEKLSSLTDSNSLHPSDSVSQRSGPMALSRSVQFSVHPSDSASQVSGPMELSGSVQLSVHPSDAVSQRSGSVGLSESAQYSIRPSDSASQQSASVKLSDSAPNSPVSEASTIRDGMSVSSALDSAVASSASLPSVPAQSLASTSPPSIPGASPSRTPLSSPPRTRGGTPEIDIVSASGRGSPARSDITVRQAVSNAQLRDMLHDLRDQTNKLMAQQNRANDAIEELQNRPPIQLPPLPATPKTPRRSPYADLLSQIADTLKNIVEAGEAARDLPAESEPAESVADSEESGTTVMNNLQNRLHDVLGMPIPPRQTFPASTVAASVRDVPDEGDAESVQSMSRPVSLYEQHIADFPRIHRPVPRRGRLLRSPSPRILERPGTAPLPSGPAWGRPTTIYRTPAPVAPVSIRGDDEESEAGRATPPAGSTGPDLDLLKLLQDKRKQRRGGDGTFIPGGDEPVEEYLEPPPRPESAPIESVMLDDPVARTWYHKRPKFSQPMHTMGDPRREESEPPSPPKSPAVVVQRRTPRPTIPLGELPSTASYAEMLALLRQNELMQRHQNEQQNELVRYLHDLNGWLARDVNNRQAELQGVEGRIAHLQNALATGRAPPPYPVYVPEQEPVMPLPPPSRMPSMRMQPHFGEPEGDDYISRMGPYGRPPPVMYQAPPPMVYRGGYPAHFGEPESPPIIPSRRMQMGPGSAMPIIEVRGMDRHGPSRSRRSPSPDQRLPQGTHTAPPATVVDPASQQSAHQPPETSQPPATNIINVNVPPTTARDRSRSGSPSRHHRPHGSSRHYDDSPSRGRSRNGSPLIVPTGSRAPRRSRRGDGTVLIREDGSFERDRSRSGSGSRSRSPIVVSGSHHRSSRHRPRSEREPVVVMQERQGSRRSRSRSPRTIMMPAIPESRRSRSRSRSSPRTVMMPAMPESRRHRSRSPRTVIMPPMLESRRSRSRSPRTIMMPAVPESRRRSRSPRTIMMPAMPESRRSRSRSPRTIMMPAVQESRRSRSPRTIVMPAPTTRRRSRSPRVVMEAPRSRSRSRSPRVLVKSSRRSRSRSPVIIQRPGSRRRSRSPRVILAGDSERHHSSHAPPVIIQGERGGSRRGLMSRLFGGGRSRSPRIIETGGRRSRSRSRSPRHVLGKRRSRTPPIIINADPRRSRSRSRSRRHAISRRERSPPLIINADSRRSRSRSPSRRHTASRRERSRTPPVVFTRSHSHRDRSRSRSPHRLERRSRSPSRRIFETSRRHGRSRSRSRSPRRRPYSSRRGHSYSPRSTRSYSPRRHHNEPHDDAAVDYDAGTRRNRGYGSSRRSHSPPRRRLSRSPEDRSRSPRRSSRSPRRSSPTRHTPSFFRRTASLFGGSRDGRPDERDRGTRQGSSRGRHDEFGRGDSRRGSPRGGTRRGDSRRDPSEYDGGRDGSPRRGLSKRGHSRQDPDEYDASRPHSARPKSRPLTEFTVGSPTRTRLTRRSPSPGESEFQEEPRGPRTHHSGRAPSPPITVVVREGEYEPFSRPGTRRPEGPLSTIHEGDSIRTSPSVIQVPGSRAPRSHATVQVAYPGSRPTSPTIIRLPGDQTPRRGTPMLRVVSAGTPRPETPSNIITIPGAAQRPPSRPQVLRVGSTQAPTPEPRARTPLQNTYIQLPSHAPAPVYPQTVRVTPGPSATPLARAELPAAIPPSIIQLPNQEREPRHYQTVRVDALPTQRDVTTPAPAHGQPSIIQVPVGGMTHGSRTIRVMSSPSQSHFPESVIQVPGRGGRETPMRSHVRVGRSTSPPMSPSIIRLPGGREVPERVPTALVRVGGGVEPQPPVIPTSEREYIAPAEQIIRLPSAVPQPPVTPSYVRVGGQPVVEQRREPTPSYHRQPTMIQLPGAAPQPPVSPSYVRVGGQLIEQRREPSPVHYPGPTTIQLPGTAYQPPMSPSYVRVGGQLIEQRREPSPSYHPGPTTIQLPGMAPQPPMSPSYVRVGGQPVDPRRESTPSRFAGPTTIQLPGTAPQPPMSPSYVRVGGQPVEPRRESTPSHFPGPTTIQLPGGAPQPPMSPSYVRVGGQPADMRREQTPSYHPIPQMIQLPSGALQPPATPSYVRVGGQPKGVDSHPAPTTIQLPNTGDLQPAKSPMIRVTAASTGTPAPASIAAPTSHLIRLPGSPSPFGQPPTIVRVPEGIPSGLTTVPGTVGTPGVVRVERQDRTPTIIQVGSHAPESRYVRATPSPGTALPGFVRAPRGGATPGLSRVPEIVHVPHESQYTPVPGASRTSFDRPASDGYPEHRPISITSVDRDNIIAPVASRSSMAGRSIADNLESMAREEEEEAEQRRRRRGAGGIPANAFAVFEDRESKRQRQFEEFLEAQRLENERLRETLMQMAPGHHRSGVATEDQGHISHLVAEAVDTIKSHRDSDRASIMSLRDDEIRRDLENERARVRELEAELARMREQLDEERSKKGVTVEDKCAEMHDAVRANHDEVRVHLADLTNVMHECKDENSRRAAEEEQRWAEKEARRQAKADQQAQLQALMAKMAADQEEDRRIADEERRIAAERPGLEEVIAQLRQQNAEQQQLLVTLLDEHRSHNAQQNHETIDAVRAAVAQHVPMDIKAHLNDFSKSLAEEVRLLLREVGKLREEKRNIQYEIGCMLCLKSKYGPGGEFDPEWRPATGPLADGPPMPSAPGEENPVPDDRPMTAPPAWRTIHTKRKPAKKREAQPAPPPPPPPMPSAPTPAPPMPVYHHQVPTAPPASAMMPPPSVMDQSRQQSWYAWQPDPRYAPSSPSSAPMYEVPESRPLGFFGPRSPRDTAM